jgi:hypothetical protein
MAYGSKVLIIINGRRGVSVKVQSNQAISQLEAKLVRSFKPLALTDFKCLYSQFGTQKLDNHKLFTPVL